MTVDRFYVVLSSISSPNVENQHELLAWDGFAWQSLSFLFGSPAWAGQSEGNKSARALVRWTASSPFFGGSPEGAGHTSADARLTRQNNTFVQRLGLAVSGVCLPAP